MLVTRVIVGAALLLGCIAGNAVDAASAPGGAAVTNVPVSGLPTYAPAITIAGANDSLYAAYGNDGDGQFPTGAVLQITLEGASKVLHAFSKATLDPASSRYYNSDGSVVSGLLSDTDGSLYGVTEIGGAAGFGTFFKLAPDGSFSVLTSFDFSSYGYFENINYGPVKAADGKFYGLTNLDNRQSIFYQVTVGGAYATVCHWDSNTQPGGILSGLRSLADGTFISVQSSGIVKVNPAGCSVTTIFAASYPGLPTLGGDGMLYATSYYGPVYRVNPDGSGGTAIAQFNPITYQYYYPPTWYCDPVLGCGWRPGHWVTADTPISAQGYDAYIALTGGDGQIYVSTAKQGLNTAGADLQIASDGSVTMLFSQPYSSGQLQTGLSALPDGRFARLLFPYAGTAQLAILNTHSSLSTSVSFSNSKVKLWQGTTMSWSSTGAKSCQLISDIPGVAAKSVATSGSKRVVLYSKKLRTPPEFTAGLQCTAADGSISNAAAALTIQ